MWLSAWHLRCPRVYLGLCLPTGAWCPRGGAAGWPWLLLWAGLGRPPSGSQLLEVPLGYCTVWVLLGICKDLRALSFLFFNLCPPFTLNVQGTSGRGKRRAWAPRVAEMGTQGHDLSAGCLHFSMRALRASAEHSGWSVWDKGLKRGEMQAAPSGRRAGRPARGSGRGGEGLRLAVFLLLESRWKFSRSADFLSAASRHPGQGPRGQAWVWLPAGCVCTGRLAPPWGECSARVCQRATLP